MEHHVVFFHKIAKFFVGATQFGVDLSVCHGACPGDGSLTMYKLKQL